MKKLGAFISSLGLVATLLGGNVAAQTSAGLNFYAEPAPGSFEKDGYYVIEAEPGDSIMQEILLRNDAKDKVTLRLYPSDATTSLYGGADYTGPDVEPEKVGTWIALQDDEVTLRPGQGARVKFRVRVPDNAPTGENLGGISIYPVEKKKSDAGTDDRAADEADVQIVVEYRRVIAVQINTPGKAEPNIMISGIEPTARPDGAYLDMNIANEGTALTTGTGVIEVPGLDYKRKFDLDTFVPNSNIRYPVRFDDSIPTGEHDATIRIEYDDGAKVVEWTNTFAVDEKLLEELAERGAPGATDIATTRGNLVPYALALAVAMFAFMMWRRTRRPDVQTATPAGPAPLAAASGPGADPAPVITATVPRVAEASTVAHAEPRPISARPSSPSAPTSPVTASGSGASKPPVKKKSTTRSAAPKTIAMKKTAPKKTASKKATGSSAAKKPAAGDLARKTTARSTTKKSTARKTAAKKPPAKKTAAKKTVAKKPAAKRVPAKKTAAKKTAAGKVAPKKSTARKAAPKKTAARKTSAKKTAAKKSTGTKAASKKSAARKTSARETSAKKTVAKKTAARAKSARRAG